MGAPPLNERSYFVSIKVTTLVRRGEFRNGGPMTKKAVGKSALL